MSVFCFSATQSSPTRAQCPPCDHPGRSYSYVLKYLTSFCVTGIFIWFVSLIYITSIVPNVRFIRFNTNLCLLLKTCNAQTVCPVHILVFLIPPLVNFNFFIFDTLTESVLPTRTFRLVSVMLYYFLDFSTQCLLRSHYSNLTLPICLIINFAFNPPLIIHLYWNLYPIQSVFVSIYYDFASWVLFIVLLLSNDIELNPGDHLTNGLFSFCNWNLNTLSKNNFQRADLLEAFNSRSKYDIISLCETSLNDSIELPNALIANYKFIPCNSLSGKKQGGVGLFYKESLPLKVRNDLSFDECIVVELIFGHKHVFFTVLYRNPCNKFDSAEFKSFLDNFENLYNKIKHENPYLVLFAGDFNAHCRQWWSDGDTNNEGTAIYDLTANLGLTQLISEPTNFQDNCAPSCIDLIFCDQPNLVTESGTLPSLDPLCKHQLTYCKINYLIPPAPSYMRKTWHYSKADINLIKRSIREFPWENILNTVFDPNWQVNKFNTVLLNIMSNFIPNKMTKITPKDPPLDY